MVVELGEGLDSWGELFVTDGLGLPLVRNARAQDQEELVVHCLASCLVAWEKLYGQGSVELDVTSNDLLAHLVGLDVVSEFTLEESLSFVKRRLLDFLVV